MYSERNKAQNNLIMMSKIVLKYLDVGPDRATDGQRVKGNLLPQTQYALGERGWEGVDWLKFPVTKYIFK